MATYIKTLKEDNGDITYPQTKAGAVLLDSGSDLETVLAAKADASTVNQKITVGDVQSTDIVANAVTTAKIANSNVTAAKLASNSVTAAKLASSAVTSSKINWDDMATKTWVPIGYAKSTTAGTNLILTVNIPTAYRLASLKFALKFELSADGWADVRCYDTSGNLIYGTYQGIFISGGTIDTSASENYTSVCSTKNVGHPYVCMQMEGQSLRFGSDGHYRSWLCRGGGGWTQSNFSFTANRDAAVGSIRFYTGGTAATGCELKVWGMIPS